MSDTIHLLQASSTSTSTLLFVHSLLRWFVLLAVAAAGLAALFAWFAKSPVRPWHRTMSVVALVLCHLQLVLGLVLYITRVQLYVQPSLTEREVVFWKYEHVGMMVLAVVLVTLGRIRSKRAASEVAQVRNIAIYYLIALVLMYMAVPWPNSPIGAGRGWL